MHRLPPQLKVSNLLIPGAVEQLRARMYHGEADRPLIVYFHGGGWVIGNLDTPRPLLPIACRCIKVNHHVN